MPTLTEALNDFLKVDRAASTATNYRRILERMLHDMEGTLDLQAVTLSHLLTHTEKLAAGIQPSSLFAYVLVIKAFFSWCEEVDYLDRSPARKLRIRKPPVEVRDRGISPADCRAILDAAHAYPRDYALVLFIGETGARIGAISRLMLSDLDLDNGRAYLTEKRRKPVWVSYGPAAAEALRQWLAVRPHVGHDSVWTTSPRPYKSMTVGGLTEVLRRISLRACGVEHSPHKWRHTVSERWEDAGVSTYDIAHKLNHAGDQVTRRHYLRNRNPNVHRLSNSLSLIAFGDEKNVPDNIIRLEMAE